MDGATGQAVKQIKAEQTVDREKIREAVNKPPEKFHDELPVHTAPSGTQYVDAADTLLNNDVWQEMQKLAQIVTRVQRQPK